MDGKYVKALRTRDGLDLLKKSHNAFILLYVIAQRARRTKDMADNLEIGEALIGDYKEYGFTRMNYRSAVALLVKHHYITIKPTNRGTVATLIDKSIYDINEEEDNQQKNRRVTTTQPTGNQRVTTNKNDKNDKNEKIKDKKDIVVVNTPLPELFEKYESSFTAEELTHKQDFLEHWMEKNEGGKKERWQMQKVFNVKKRFRTWLNNDLKWKQKYSSSKQLNVFHNEPAEECEYGCTIDGVRPTPIADGVLPDTPEIPVPPEPEPERTVVTVMGKTIRVDSYGRPIIDKATPSQREDGL